MKRGKKRKKLKCNDVSESACQSIDKSCGGTPSRADRKGPDNPKKHVFEATGMSTKTVKHRKKDKKTKRARGITEEKDRVLSVLDKMLDSSEVSGLTRSRTSNRTEIEKEQRNPRSESLGKDFGSEESEVEFHPQEEKAKALAVLDLVLEKDSPDDDISDEELHGKEKSPAGKSRKVFIGNLPWKAEPYDVQQDFEKYGEIDSFNMPRNKETGKPMGIAFIVYASVEGMERALSQDGSTYSGRKIRVKAADPQATGKSGKKVTAHEDQVSREGGVGKAMGKANHVNGGLEGRSGLGQTGKSKGKSKGKNPWWRDRGHSATGSNF